MNSPRPDDCQICTRLKSLLENQRTRLGNLSRYTGEWIQQIGRFMDTEADLKKHQEECVNEQP